ncbi:DUF6361 family protein [Isoptericola croceus]|uniref:DUF6361 family protein n=1 Tax=Isoptericola croceus TaxID=3031406 RepID=UPI0023F768C5|nr:DUF6361 family protein [Isoptericola croceus]
MVSSFGWLDVDAEQWQQMLEVVDLFRETGTVDDLGVGTIRDAISDPLFPGTSARVGPTLRGSCPPSWAL